MQHTPIVYGAKFWTEKVLTLVWTLRYYDSINLETHQLVTKDMKLIQATKIWGLPKIVAMNL